VRRLQAAKNLARERKELDELAARPARLVPEFRDCSSSDLLEHFRTGNRPKFFAGFEEPAATAYLFQRDYRLQVAEIIESARRITDHRWPLLGFEEIDFGQEISWNRDPLSGRMWPTDFHADIVLWHNDGSDIRVLWELNRMGHLLTLGQAYALTRNEEFAEEFFAQLESWRDQNRLGRGPSWCCAMEVALRAMNLLAAFALFRDAPSMTPKRLMSLLAMFDQHGHHIKRNLEFSYVATSNHYLSDVAGLWWLGIMLPELNSAEHWKRWALNELLREMDRQVLPDGADYEASTGYHRLVLELFLYSFILCRNNDVSIEDRYWQKLHLMFKYLRAILRPDGFAPLIGDSDGGQVLPIMPRRADDHAYLLSFGAAIFHDGTLKLPAQKGSAELLWVLGAAGLKSYDGLSGNSQAIVSQAFPDSGTYVLRNEDLYLLFNIGASGMAGRGSHGHNDALAIEVSACGRAFLVDPGTYVYTADLTERQLFRSTAYHSTLQLNGEEQNVTNERTPFVIGNEAHPRALRWESNAERDLVSAEHIGYERLAEPIRHRRTIIFEKAARRWFVEDELPATGKHTITARFHFDAGLDIEPYGHNCVMAQDKKNGARLFICPLDIHEPPRFEHQFSSRHYGLKLPSVSACWSIKTTTPCTLRWAILPFCAGESELERLEMVSKLRPMEV
jgi:heparinase II/III-like protein